TQNRVLLEIPLRIGQLIQIVDQWAHLRCAHPVFCVISNAQDIPPLLASAETIRQLKQSQLTFKPHYAIQFGQELQRARIAQAGKMAAHGEVTVQASFAKILNQKAKMENVRMKDQEEPDQDRIKVRGHFQD